MNNCNYMFNNTLFKDIGTFLSKTVYAQSHDQNALDDPKSFEMFCTYIRRILWSKQKVCLQNWMRYSYSFTFLGCQVV